MRRLHPRPRPRRAAALVALASALAGLTAVAPASPAAAADRPSAVLDPIVCRPFIVYGTRGSGMPILPEEDGTGAEVGKFVDDLRGAVGESNVKAYYNNYPAALEWTYVGQNWQPYWDSVWEGSRTGRSDLRRIADACRTSTIIVAGHSQGADVTRRIFIMPPEFLEPARTKVLLFGDVNFRWDEANIAKSGKFNKQNGLVPTGVAAGVTIPTEPGAPSSTPAIPGIPAAWHAESWCHEADAACQTIGTGDEPHNNYGLIDGQAAAYRVARFAGGTAATAIPVVRYGTVTCPTGASPSVVPVSLSTVGSAAGTSVTFRGYWDNSTTPVFTQTLTAGQTATQNLNLPFNPWQPQLKVVWDRPGSDPDVQLEERFVYPAC